MTVRLGTTLALRDVDFRVNGGEHVALVGPNGSGKTSLLLALKGAIVPQRGRVALGCARVERLDLRVGLVFANPEDQGVAPVVEDDVAFGLENQGLSPGEIQRRVEECLRSVGLWALRSAPVHALSGGQAQKMALAGVLALGARFLLLDEATSMLSPWERDSVMGTVTALRGEGVGVVQVTHQAEELLRADRVVSLAGGVVAFEGTPEAYFAWEGRGLPLPAYEGVRRAAAKAGSALPPHGELTAWVARC
ncbi:MAG: ATP-binding cassette domain-containing protein [Proteobacteria bacterium]|nr:ATP-binding cassette domain-containing protein [Pseudomonadota bacterium]